MNMKKVNCQPQKLNLKANFPLSFNRVIKILQAKLYLNYKCIASLSSDYVFHDT